MWLHCARAPQKEEPRKGHYPEDLKIYSDLSVLVGNTGTLLLPSTPLRQVAIMVIFPESIQVRKGILAP